MITEKTLLASALALVAQAAQPGSVSPVVAPMRELTWGQLNFLHTTDTHGWLGGHLQEPQYSGDWGDYISFAHHMRAKADDKGADVLLVDTGDRVEGNGLYDASTPKGLYQYDIYAEQDVDIICTGNHELYQRYSALREHNTTTKNFKDSYVASNLDYIDPETGEQSPMAPRYRKFRTKNQGLEVISMGFLFDFTGNANNTVVQPVEETIEEEWFQNVIKEKPDIFVIIGHIGLRMEEFELIFKALRKEDWDTPVAIFGGHAHVRDARSYGSRSLAMASGRYMETIGWMSVDGIKKRDDDKKDGDEPSAEASVTFTRKYIDNNLLGMYHHTGLNETTFPTEHGKKVTKAIDDARKALSLDDKFGCAPQTYWMSRRKFPHDESVYTLLQDEILPAVIVGDERENKPRLALLNTGGIRFDIFKGPFSKDSLLNVSPFLSIWQYIPDVPYDVAQRVLGLLNSGGNILSGTLDAKFMANPDQMFPVAVTSEEDPHLELRSVQIPLAGDPELTSGYTTKDDIGKDGDDTVHEPIQFFKQPNVIQAEIDFPRDSKPETVDLVFIDFVQPWIILALKFSGGDYSHSDVKDYMRSTMATKLGEWANENWGGEC